RIQVGNNLSKFRQVLSRRTFQTFFRGETFQRHANLERFQNVFRRNFGNVSTAAWVDLHQTFSGQAIDRVLHRREADGQFRRQFANVQSFTGREDLRENAVAK